MKKVSLHIVLLLLSAFIFVVPLNAQVIIRGNGEITKQMHKVDNFDAIKVSGARTVILNQGDSFSVEVETDSNLHEYITLEVKNGTLDFGFNTKKIKKYKELNFYVTAPDYKNIKASGASEVTSNGSLNGDKLQIDVSGASELDLDADYTTIITKLSGASDVVLSGTAITSTVTCSGASEFQGKNLVATNSIVSASGASNCFVNAKSNLTYEASGSSDVNYTVTPETVVVKKNRNDGEVIVIANTSFHQKYNVYPDTTNVDVGSLNVTVVDGDTTLITVGRHTLSVSDNGDVKWGKCKRKKFNGHWGGFELGINGYVTPDFNTNWKSEYDYLNLRYEKSIAVNLNIYEQNISLNKNKTIGLVTGLGFSWNNYRFSGSTFLTPDSSNFKGFAMVNTDGSRLSLRKTKLTAMYLTVPLIFEMQTNNSKLTRRFHFAFGVIANLRISTHTKVYFNEANKKYQLYDLSTDEVLPITYTTPNSSNRNIVKNFNSFYLQPFKFDATIRFGYGIINLFATYSLNTMFQKDRGPELYPFTAGITLVGW